MVEVMPEDRIARLMTIRDPFRQGNRRQQDRHCRTTRCATTTPGQPTRSSRKRPAHRIRQTHANPIEIAGLAAGIASKAIRWQRSSTPARGFWRRWCSKPEATKRKTSFRWLLSKASSLARLTSRRSSERHKWASVRHCRRGMRGLKMARGPCRFLGLRMSPAADGRSPGGKAAAFGLRSEEADKIINSIGRDGAVQPGTIKRMGEAVPFVGGALWNGAEFHAKP